MVLHTIVCNKQPVRATLSAQHFLKSAHDSRNTHDILKTTTKNCVLLDVVKKTDFCTHPYGKIYLFTHWKGKNCFLLMHISIVLFE